MRIRRTASRRFFLSLAAAMPLISSPVVGEKGVFAAEPEPGATRTNPRDGLTYVWAGKGEFRMGCPEQNSECTSLEKPAHPVTISKGFWIGQTEVTQAAYKRVAGKNPSRFEGDNLPVENLSWDEAEAYCVAVGGRLPTEAEWEFAARGGPKPGQGYGDIAAAAWFAGNSGGRPHEVAQKAPNSLGLYDTLGNVWEWVSDGFVPGYVSEAQRNPRGPRRSSHHTIRGAAWYDEARYVRWTYRTGVALRFRLNVGVRCVGN